MLLIMLFYLVIVWIAVLRLVASPRRGNPTSRSITLAAVATGIAVGEVIEITGSTGPVQRRVIPAWDNGTKIALVTPNWTVTPDATTTYAVKATPSTCRPPSDSIPEPPRSGP